MKWIAYPSDDSWEPIGIRDGTRIKPRCVDEGLECSLYCCKSSSSVSIPDSYEEWDCCNGDNRECGELPFEECELEESPIKVEIIEISGRVAKTGQSDGLKTRCPQGHRRFKSGLGHKKDVSK
jgi:hypothetical protein